ncbi:hypothetical protein, partial [Paraburkholderia sp. NMBU_R16]|uniref:hypothetical protein n=1 Tax=Paraburkholderia sp. NMBU_R16 TaxID=2698676 RepID=UPI001C25C538
PLRLPGLASGSVTVMSIKSKMMGTTLMSVLAVVYDGRREALTMKDRSTARGNARLMICRCAPYNNSPPARIRSIRSFFSPLLSRSIAKPRIVELMPVSTFDPYRTTISLSWR